jgi:hypothetical protein
MRVPVDIRQRHTADEGNVIPQLSARYAPRLMLLECLFEGIRSGWIHSSVLDMCRSVRCPPGILVSPGVVARSTSLHTRLRMPREAVPCIRYVICQRNAATSPLAGRRHSGLRDAGDMRQAVSSELLDRSPACAYSASRTRIAIALSQVQPHRGVGASQATPRVRRCAVGAGR